MSRPKKHDTVAMHVLIDPALKARLEQACEDRLVGRNLFVNAAIRRMLDALEPEPIPNTFKTYALELPEVVAVARGGPEDHHCALCDHLRSSHTQGHPSGREPCACDACDDYTPPSSPCRQPDCTEPATHGPWCEEHFTVILNQPDYQ